MPGRSSYPWLVNQSTTQLSHFQAIYQETPSSYGCLAVLFIDIVQHAKQDVQGHYRSKGHVHCHKSTKYTRNSSLLSKVCTHDYTKLLGVMKMMIDSFTASKAATSYASTPSFNAWLLKLTTGLFFPPEAPLR